jgi:hypothetical protein
MPLVDFYTSDPGLAELASNTKINIIEQLAQAVRITAGRGSVGIFGAVVNDRGAPNIPVRIVPEDLKVLYGGFKSWMGDAVDHGAVAVNYNDRGSLSGYEGNLVAQVEGLDAPLLVLTVPDLSLYDVSIDSTSPLPQPMLAEFNRVDGTYGTYTLPAGTRLKPVTGDYRIATLEPVTWVDDDDSTQSVRVRQVSDTTVTPVAMNTVTVFVDTPADTQVTCVTAEITAPLKVDVAELDKRYQLAFATSLTYATGQICELVACDRTESLIVDSLFTHASDASAEGYFRLAVGSPPLGTPASGVGGAEDNTGDGVGRPTLLNTYGGYLHQGWTRQFPDDSANLNVEQGYQHDIPSALSFAYNAALFRPEENPANWTENLTRYRITGVEALSPAPNRKAHEDAGIIQPILEYVNPGGLSSTLQPTFHGAPLADAVTKFYTRRFAFFLYRSILAVANPFHKKCSRRSAPAGTTRRQALGTRTPGSSRSTWRPRRSATWTF